MLADPAQCLANFAACAADAKTFGAANGAPASTSKRTIAAGKRCGQERRNTPDRAGLALDIEQREIAFGRGVEFEDPRDGEALP